MKIDLRLVEIDYELWALGRYLDIIDRNIPRLSKSERDRLLENISSSVSEFEDFVLLSQEADRIEEDVIPRHLRGSFIVALWAVFEAAVSTVAKHIQCSENLRLSLSDVTGDFLGRSRKYFDNILEFTLVKNESDWQILRNLETIRHVVAHANSRLGDLDNSKRKKVSAVVKSTIGLREVDELLLIEEIFCRSCYATVTSVLQDLISRTKSTFR